MKITIQQLQQLKKNGFIRDYSQNKAIKSESSKVLSKKLPSGNRAKMKFESDLYIFCRINKLTIKKEYKFHPTRKWRFDWYIVEINCAVEWNGIMSNKSRHTTIIGYSEDMNKINAAQKMKIQVLQFTPLNCKNLLQEINFIYEETIKK